MNRLPATRSKRWLVWMLVYGLLLSFFLLLNRFIVVGETLQIGIAFRFVLLAFVLSVVVNGLGWAGARYIWLLTTIGLAIGLGLMYYYSVKDMTGWQDLVSLLGFIEGVAIGFILGVVVEVIHGIGNRRSRKK
ncbi:MAG: hypothetical protein K6T85_18650 [Gorillibacterium sp.]|nr:hypothetical protein [Gorillibacterium sp.]